MTATEPRSQRYLARLDAVLTQAQTDCEVARILTRELNRWEALYKSFLIEAEADEVHPEGPQATDFFLTICGISKRLAVLHSPGGA